VLPHAHKNTRKTPPSFKPKGSPAQAWSRTGAFERYVATNSPTLVLQEEEVHGRGAKVGGKGNRKKRREKKVLFDHGSRNKQGEYI
jgi:hypothetical protein